MSDLTTGYTWANGSTVTAARLNTAIEDATLAPAAISGKTAKTTVVDADELLIWDSATSALNRMTRENLLGLLTAGTVHGQTAKTSLVDADEFLIWDSAATALKRVTKANLLTAVQPAGSVLQVKNSQSQTQVSGSTDIPLDNTIPQNSEGTEILTVTITPAADSNTVLIQANFMVSANAGKTMVLALFRDSGSDAIAVTSRYATGNASVVENLTLAFMDSPSTTDPITYKIRFGVNGATYYVNDGSTAYFGSKRGSSLVAQEIKG